MYSRKTAQDILIPTVVETYLVSFEIVILIPVEK